MQLSMFNLGTTPLSAQPGLTTKLHSKAPGNHSGLSQGWGGVGGGGVGEKLEGGQKGPYY